MKFIKIFLLLFFLSLTSSYAQLFQAGLSSGISTSQYDGDGYSGYNKLGLSAGGFVKTDFNEKWSLQFEIIYIQKGAIRNPKPDKGYFNQYSIKLNYIEVPLLLKYTHKDLVFESGIGLGVLTKEEEVVNYLDITGMRPFNKTELGFNLGINYPLTKQFDINWRFTYSILPVRSFPAGTTYFLNIGECNNVMAFTLKYTFSQAKQINNEK